MQILHSRSQQKGCGPWTGGREGGRKPNRIMLIPASSTSYKLTEVSPDVMVKVWSENFRAMMQKRVESKGGGRGGGGRARSTEAAR